MTHLLSSDIYKLKKAKYFWICLIINIVLAAGSVFLLDFAYKINGVQMNTQVKQQETSLNDAGVNVSAGNIAGSLEDLTGSKQFVSFFAGNTTLLLAVLISLFVGSEFNHGTIKNVATKNYSRRNIYLSKLIVSILCGIVLTLIYAFVSEITAIALWGFGDISSGYWPLLLKSAGIELLLSSAFVSIFVMFSMFIRQNGGSLAANICFLEFISLVVMLGEMLIKQLFDKVVKLSDYLIDTNMTAVSSGLTQTVAVRSIAVGCGFLLVATVAGMWSFQKRDIK